MLAANVRFGACWRAAAAGAIAFAGFNVTAQTWSDTFPGDGHLQGAVQTLAIHSSELYLGGEFGGLHEQTSVTARCPVERSALGRGWGRV
jgi:hypothetical protein